MLPFQEIQIFGKTVMQVKHFFQKILLRLARYQMDLCMGVVVKARPDWNPRQWSNRELRKFTHLFKGDVINVGAWRDEDKEGNYYKSYFSNAKTYVKANYRGEDGATDSPDEIFLDLSVPVKENISTFDLVFSHTVLEHVYPLTIAFDNICSLSNDSVLVVVPFIQCFHGRDGSYGDYSRFTPMLLDQLFRERGFEVIYMSWNEDFPVMNVYLLVLASRNPSRFLGQIPSYQKAIVGKSGPGITFSKFLWGDDSNKSFWRKAGEFIGALVQVRPNNI